MATSLAVRGRWVERGLLLLAVAMTIALASVVVRRVAFPWDYYIWSESPFLTNLWTLHLGRPLFEDPERARSFVYSPGLEWITYGILAPFGRDLDVVACRVVNVAIGGVAAFAAAKGSSTLAVDGGGAAARRYPAFACLLFVLLGARNFTFDVCHPDNLHLAHAGIAFVLTLTALRSNDWRFGLAAVCWAALGVFAKQTAAGGWLGVAL